MRQRDAFNIGPAPATGLVLVATLALAGCADQALPRPVAPPPAAVMAPAPESKAPPAEPELVTPPASSEPDARWEEQDGVVEDELPSERELIETPVVHPHPLDGWSDAEIARAVRDDPSALGSISVGTPSNGRLLNGVQLETDTSIETVSPGYAWGSQETIDYLRSAVRWVHERFPQSPKLFVGHISAKQGGHLRPHLSHQSGRDVDLSYYYLDGASWYTRATQTNLDLPRNWALVRAFITETDVEMILIDHTIQRWLEDYAISIGEDRDWLDSVFRGARGRRAIVRHARGHRTHLHVRFFNPIAEQTARRAYTALIERGLVKPLYYTVMHTVKKGETLIGLARRYGTTVRAIQRANRLKSTLIMAKKSYRIPQTGVPAPHAKGLGYPPRRMPPTTPAAIARLEPAATAGKP